MLSVTIKLIIVGTITIVTWGFLIDSGVATPASLPFALVGAVVLWAAGAIKLR